MVCSITNAASKDGVVATEVIHLGRSFGECNETARDPNTRSWSRSPKNPHVTGKIVYGNVEFETGQDNSPKSVQGGMAHKMQGPGA